MRKASRITTLLTFALLASSYVDADDLPAKQRFMGTGSCSSSNCHGSTSARTGNDILQNEYVTWLKHDKHSQAFNVLAGPDSKKIAANLSIKDPQKEKLCLDCHATYVSEKLRGPKYVVEDGVSCESCHGAAESWLETHSQKGSSHAENVKHGMKDLNDMHSRAVQCLSCHYGTDEKTVNHRLYGAGHPRLSFELDTFGVLQAKHWAIDKDYVDRKGPYVPLKAWLAGQVALSQETLKALKSPTRSKFGIFPELSLFDCYSCHHSLTDDQWKKRSYGNSPGELHLNLPSLLMIREISTAITPAISKELASLVETLHNEYVKNGAASGISRLETLIDGPLVSATKNFEVNDRTAKSVAASLINFCTAKPFFKYEVAEQTAMGIQAALASSESLGKTYKASLDKMFDSLTSSESFEPEKFTAACSEFKNQLAK